MIWLTWRQHRLQALFALGALAVLAAVLVPTGLQMYNTMADTGLDACLRKLGRGEFVEMSAAEACDRAAGKFENAYATRGNVAPLLIFLPLLAGLFWGAPLVAREVEHGTHRLVWTQGTTRRRWALVKFGALTAAVVVAATAYSLLLGWWLTPLERAGVGRFDFPFFDLQGLTPIGYTLFAVALGVFAGTMTRRVLPAMAITLVGFLAVRIGVTLLARPRYMAPLERTFPVASTAPSLPNPALDDWVLADGVYDRAGNLVERNATALCQQESPADPCLGGVGAYNGVTYQPGDRYWTFQYIETGLFVAAAVVLLAFALRQIRRRIA